MGNAINGTKKARILKGIVVSDKMVKTAVVAVSRLRKHSKYKKYYKVTKRYKAHDESNDYRTGDLVLIQETRPISRGKRWKIIDRIGVKAVSDKIKPAKSDIAK